MGVSYWHPQMRQWVMSGWTIVQMMGADYRPCGIGNGWPASWRGFWHRHLPEIEVVYLVHVPGPLTYVRHDGMMVPVEVSR